MSQYVKIRKSRDIPRLPLEGFIDLTYRCNNSCRHCWIRTSANAQEELSLDEITGIVDQARQMGCRRWSISGGEPMLRVDFVEILEYIIKMSVSYSINTNGSLITPKIAELMSGRSTNVVAIYGATAEVHDHITQNPGSFEATMRGFAYLKEAGAGFLVQLIPMKDNYHQFGEMVRLAESLGPRWKIGASWLYLSACGDQKRNREIMRQRLDPRDVVELENPNISYEEWSRDINAHAYSRSAEDDRIFASCISRRNSFHVDPYGQMSFCSFIRDPALRYDLRRGCFEECWEEFIPSLKDSVRGGREFLENCNSCDLGNVCRWCAVYGYLEHGRFSAKVEYLCSIARESKRFRDEKKKTHRRYYQIAGITVQVGSDLPITDSTFHPKFSLFQVDGPGEDTISINHCFSLPNLDGRDLGKELYRRHPWRIYRREDSWTYLNISRKIPGRINRVAVFNHDHTRARMYSMDDKRFRKGNLNSLTLFPTDQILLAQVLAEREGCYIHSSGVSLHGRGFLFIGHSGAGKSTMVTLLKDEAEILCDDRMIVRKWPEGFRIYGTWSHGDVPEVSAGSAPLKGIMFLKQANENRLIPIDDRKEIREKLLDCLVRPLVTVDWWHNMLTLVDSMACEVPCYTIQFDKSGRVLELLQRL